jgi:hypothetical protein
MSEAHTNTILLFDRGDHHYKKKFCPKKQRKCFGLYGRDLEKKRWKTEIKKNNLTLSQEVSKRINYSKFFSQNQVLSQSILAKASTNRKKTQYNQNLL